MAALTDHPPQDANPEDGNYGIYSTAEKPST
jgi:hypothetical protein